MQKLFTFFSKNISVYVILNDQSLTILTLTNDIVSFEKLGPGVLLYPHPKLDRKCCKGK